MLLHQMLLATGRQHAWRASLKANASQCKGQQPWQAKFHAAFSGSQVKIPSSVAPETQIWPKIV
jgi:hypothetical protein